jgi:uncharacterized YigZ family protein
VLLFGVLATFLSSHLETAMPPMCGTIARMTNRYPVPAAEMRTETKVKNSLFIATAAPVNSVDEAKAFVQRIRAEFADATHNVPAYLVGFGNTVTAHCADDGEPAGTAGRPMLAVLQGSGIGDVAVVVTRYFGGTKLGTGGLVRAYSDAVKEVLAQLPLAEKVPTHTVMLALPYHMLERVRLLVVEWHGRILDETFAADITMTLLFVTTQFPAFQQALQELSHGTLEAEIVETQEATLMPLGAFTGGNQP